MVRTIEIHGSENEHTIVLFIMDDSIDISRWKNGNKYNPRDVEEWLTTLPDYSWNWESSKELLVEDINLMPIPFRQVLFDLLEQNKISIFIQCETNKDNNV